MGSLRRLGNARELIEDAEQEKLLSTASPREMAIKHSLGRLTVAGPFDVLIPRQRRLNGMRPLNIERSRGQRDRRARSVRL